MTFIPKDCERISVKNDGDNIILRIYSYGQLCPEEILLTREHADLLIKNLKPKLTEKQRLEKALSIGFSTGLHSKRTFIGKKCFSMIIENLLNQ